MAPRRLGAGESRRLKGGSAGRIFVAGIVVAVLPTIPVLNLVAPIVATAFMLHPFEGMQGPRSR